MTTHVMKTTDNKDEVFVVVDKTDTIIGYRTREECHSNKDLIHRGVGIIVTNDKNEILLQKRSKTKDTHPGFWTISASGHVGKGESYEQAAKREMFEEIGIQAAITCLTMFLYSDGNETEFDTLFTTRHNGPFTTSKDEVASVAFMDKKTIASMTKQLSPYAIRCLEKAKIL